MFQLIIGTNMNRTSLSYELGKTLRQALDEQDIDYSVGVIHLDGASLRAGDLDKTFEELGITTKAQLIVVVKGDAA